MGRGRDGTFVAVEVVGGERVQAVAGAARLLGEHIEGQFRVEGGLGDDVGKGNRQSAAPVDDLPYRFGLRRHTLGT